MARVVPVRKRLRSGYAIDMRRTGASASILPSPAIAAPRSRSALYTITQTAPTTIRRPVTIHVEKSMESGPKTDSQALQGSIRSTTMTMPATVNASRSGTPTRRANGTRLTMIERDAEHERRGGVPSP